MKVKFTKSQTLREAIKQLEKMNITEITRILIGDDDSVIFESGYNPDENEPIEWCIWHNQPAELCTNKTPCIVREVTIKQLVESLQ